MIKFFNCISRITFISILLTIYLRADTYDSADTTYACIAYFKDSNGKTERLDMNESIAKGGYFRFSVKINFLRAIVSRDKDTINNITYEDMRFAFRDTVKDYDMYVYDYDKSYFLIEKDNKKEPRFSIKLENGDRIYHKCMMFH